MRGSSCCALLCILYSCFANSSLRIAHSVQMYDLPKVKVSTCHAPCSLSLIAEACMWYCYKVILVLTLAPLDTQTSEVDVVACTERRGIDFLHCAVDGSAMVVVARLRLAVRTRLSKVLCVRNGINYFNMVHGVLLENTNDCLDCRIYSHYSKF